MTHHPTLSRRQLLLAAAATATFGCTKKEQKASPAPATLTWPRKSTHAGVEMIELFPNGADEQAPFVVVIHGMGDRPEHWVEDWRHFPARAHVVLPRAFTPYADGFSWFDYQPGMTEAELGKGIGDAEAKLWPGVLEVAAGRKIIATGFSQGGMLSWTIAARRAGVVTHAFPVSGGCAAPLRPTNKSPAVPVLAFHGTADTLVPIAWDRASVAAFKANGNQAELREYEGVTHAISPQVRTDWYAAVEKSITAT